MDDKIYAVLYDRDFVDTEELHTFISTSKIAKNWWHYLKSCYLIKSAYSAAEIVDSLPRSLRRPGFLVLEVDIHRADGWLTEKAWAWIERRREEEKSDRLSR
jgi:hypothetical protein